jgi:hypothetical protein
MPSVTQSAIQALSSMLAFRQAQSYSKCWSTSPVQLSIANLVAVIPTSVSRISHSHSGKTSKSGNLQLQQHTKVVPVDFRRKTKLFAVRNQNCNPQVSACGPSTYASRVMHGHNLQRSDAGAVVDGLNILPIDNISLLSDAKSSISSGTSTPSEI